MGRSFTIESARLISPTLAIASTTLVILAGCGPTASPTTAPVELAIVEFVVDGDTVDLWIDGTEERVRLIGIDSPESVDPDRPVQCFGPEASAALTGLLPPGSGVRIERDEEARDRFGRLLLYLHRADDDLSVNRWMLEQGFADVLFFEPNTARRSEFTAVRDGARTAGLGLWGACDGPDQPLQ